MSLLRASAVRRLASAGTRSSGASGFATHAPAAPVSAAAAHPSRLPPYEALLAQLRRVRAILGRPLTLAEKILYAHLRDPDATLAGAASSRDPSLVRGKLYLPLAVDRLAMQDASAQMALLQFMTCGLAQTAVPASVHCDHLIQAFEGAEADLKVSRGARFETTALTHW